MKVAVASDHAGFKMKEHVKNRLNGLGHQVEDYGTHDEASCDYPDFGRPAAEAVAHGKAEMAILFCGTGIGMSLVANKVRFVRAAVCSEPHSAFLARSHNNANVLCVGARMIGLEMVDQILSVFLNSKYEGGRHDRRLDKIES